MGPRFEDDAIVVPFTKEQVKDSPDVAPDAISEHLEKELYSYYGRHGEWGREFGEDREPAERGSDPLYGEARIRRWQWEYR